MFSVTDNVLVLEKPTALSLPQEFKKVEKNQNKIFFVS
jgi:hypothetical protein